MKPPIEYRPVRPEASAEYKEAMTDTWRVLDKVKFDRTAYQREYMRKRRAKLKIT
jgi:hypothetical protein